MDGNNCPFDIDTTIVGPPLLTLEFDATDPLCYGIPTGEIILFPDGGTPFPIAPAYTFNWSNQSLSGDHLSELPEGIYALSLTDSDPLSRSKFLLCLYKFSLISRASHRL